MAFLTVLQNTENARAEGEFRGLILATTVGTVCQVLAGFLFCYMYFFFSFENRKMLRIEYLLNLIAHNFRLERACL